MLPYVAINRAVIEPCRRRFASAPRLDDLVLPSNRSSLIRGASSPTNSASDRVLLNRVERRQKDSVPEGDLGHRGLALAYHRDRRYTERGCNGDQAREDSAAGPPCRNARPAARP